MHLLNVTDKSGPSPGVGVVALVPVDAISQESQPCWESWKGEMGGKEEGQSLQGFSSCDARVGGPGASENDVVLLVKEVGWYFRHISSDSGWSP